MDNISKQVETKVESAVQLQSSLKQSHTKLEHNLDRILETLEEREVSKLKPDRATRRHEFDEEDYDFEEGDEASDKQSLFVSKGQDELSLN